MKKLFAVILCLIMVFILASCGGTSGGDGETYELRLATHYNTEHAGYAAIEKAVAAVEEATDGAVKIKV